jgi:hypothetical protein
MQHKDDLETKEKKTIEQGKNELWEAVMGSGGIIHNQDEEIRVFRDSRTLPNQRRIVVVARKTTIIDLDDIDPNQKKLL